MKFSVKDRDWIIVNEENLSLVKENNKKTHLIKLAFERPTDDMIEEVLDRFPSTNRFIIEDNIKFYNDILKSRKKYYVENKVGHSLISHFKRNNKVLLNYNRLNESEKDFVIENIKDVLKNLEVFYIDDFYKHNLEMINEFKKWNGNILIKK